MLPKSLSCIINGATFEDFSANILTLRIPKNFSNIFTEDLKLQFEEILAQKFGRKIRVEANFDEMPATIKISKKKISNRQFLEDILNVNKTVEEISGADDFDIEISNKENPDSEEDLPDFLKYTLKIFETTNFEKINDDEE